MTPIAQPFAREAEEALLGSVLINPSITGELSLTPEDFYLVRNGDIYRTICDLQHAGKAADFVTITEALDNAGKLAEVGGMSYLVQLSNAMPSSLNYDSYQQIIKDKARRRHVLTTAQALAKAALDEGADLDAASEQAADELTRNTAGDAGAQHWGADLDDLYNDIVQRMASPNETPGLATGLPKFDRLTGGLQDGEVLLIKGAPGIGKSILSYQFGDNFASHNRPGVIYSLEMRARQVARRMLSVKARVATHKLKTGRIDGSEFEAINKAYDRCRTLPVYLCDKDLTTATLRADLTRLKARYGIQWFVLDYLYILGLPDNEMRGLNMTERTELLSMRVKRMAASLGLVGITVNSVTKDGDSRGSNQIKHDVDMIASLVEHQPEPGMPKKANMRTLIFEKARDLADSDGYIQLVKNAEYPYFLEAM